MYSPRSRTRESNKARLQVAIMLAMAPCLVVLFQYSAAKITGKRAENPLKHQMAKSKTLAFVQASPVHRSVQQSPQ